MSRSVAWLILIILCFTLIPAEGSAESFSLSKNWSLNIQEKIGGATYAEKEQTIKSEWRNIYYRSDVGLDNLRDHSTAIKVIANLGFFAVPTNTETWHVNNIKYQTNDMGFWGITPGLELGYQFNNLDSQKRCSFAPFLGYNYKHIKFKRTNFNILNIITSRDIVSEAYDIHYLDLGTYWDYKVGEKWGAFSRISYGFVLSNKADNSALGIVNGGGGYIIKTDLGLEYQLNDKSSVGFGGFFEIQKLEGGSKGNVIWPDNYLDTYGVLVNYKI